MSHGLVKTESFHKFLSYGTCWSCFFLLFLCVVSDIAAIFLAHSLCTLLVTLTGRWSCCVYLEFKTDGSCSLVDITSITFWWFLVYLLQSLVLLHLFLYFWSLFLLFSYSLSCVKTTSSLSKFICFNFFYFVRHMLILTLQLFQNLLYNFALSYPLFSLLPSGYWLLSDSFYPNTHDIHFSLSNVYVKSCFVWDYSFSTSLLPHLSPDFFLCLIDCFFPIVKSFHLGLLLSLSSHTSARLYWLVIIKQHISMTYSLRCTFYIIGLYLAGYFTITHPWNNFLYVIFRILPELALPEIPSLGCNINIMVLCNHV